MKKSFVWLLLCIMILMVFLAGCSSDDSIEIDASDEPDEIAAKILGGIKEEDIKEGLVDVRYLPKLESVPARMNVFYNYTPSGRIDLGEEIGMGFAKKTRSLYENIVELDELVFVIRFPFQDNYGNITWGKGIQFTMTREIFNKINWDDDAYVQLNFLKMVKDVQVAK